MNWEHGRELTSMTSGTKTWTNTYNANGLRTKRTDGSVTFTYYYVGDKLTQVYINGIAVQLIYDANGSPLAVRYNGVMYYYVTNLQGDVTALLDTSSNAVVQYTYDAWGNILQMPSTKYINNNPLRYRGYVYDTETGLYYLQSRYYDPKIGRFINADSLVITGQGVLGNNMFAYCLNNPVNGVDPCGTCFHRLDFWNDCEECGGEEFKDKFDSFLTTIYNYQVMVREDQRRQTELQMQLIYQTTVTLVDAHIRAEQTLAESQRMQDVLVAEFILDRFSTPEKAKNTLGGVKVLVGTGAAYCGAVAAKWSIPTLGMSVAYAGSAAVGLAIVGAAIDAVIWVIDIVNE